MEECVSESEAWRLMIAQLGNLGYIHSCGDHIIYHPDQDIFESERGI